MVMHQKDYMLRQIEMMAKAIGKMLGIQVEYHPLEGVVVETGVLPGDAGLRATLQTLVAEGRINAAEDLLFERIEQQQKAEYMGVALEFYAALMQMDAYELEMYGFSRQEVLDGLTEVKEIYERSGNG